MLTGMVKETRATMILTMTESRILLTTAHWSPTEIRLTVMVTQKEMSATTVPTSATIKRMLMEMVRVMLVMMILMVMDASIQMITAPRMPTLDRLMGIQMGMETSVITVLMLAILDRKTSTGTLLVMSATMA